MLREVVDESRQFAHATTAFEADPRNRQTMLGNVGSKGLYGYVKGVADRLPSLDKVPLHPDVRSIRRLP